VFNNIKITLHCSVYMRTSGEKVRISDEVERVQSVSYSHIRSLSGLYTLACFRRGPALRLLLASQTYTFNRTNVCSAGTGPVANENQSKLRGF